jgi:acyl-CoA thioesterase FadM
MIMSSHFLIYPFLCSSQNSTTTTAAYLTHAEYARWELVSYNGMLKAMYKNNVNYLVVGTTIRYRKEIRPIFRRFQIDTTVCGIDERNMWISHKFRLPAKEKHNESRVMAEMIVQGVAVKGRDVVNPGNFLKEDVGMDADLVGSVTMPHAAHKSKIVEEMLERYVALEESMKKSAAEDDEKHK